ncbi:glycosyltransferase family 4 protein [Capillimicrobium parvum]|uniref:D-inositol-3-phosphate glycosyltransferase n=1 Tax=Capillimicrobium parvum TaxID=2884022 RepID=A0A9E6XZU7_9ACTN|nr:glycosyltransferase family 1 protein [Capillimicrobium parvum]UGS37429.1 D-inositol-3-phosphate glycosyltransferase [Capillimicrobium parvum]
MRVGIDARHLPEGRGVARYLQRTLAALAQGFPQDEWVALVPGRAAVAAPGGVEVVRTRLPGRALFAAGALAGRPTLQRLLGGVDVVWLPAPAPVALEPNAPYVLTVHDLSFEQRPSDYTAYERLWHRAGRLGALARGASQVVAVSGPTRDAVIERWGVPARRVEVVHPGAGAVTNQGRAGVAPAPDAHRYLLFVGALEPRKAPELLAGAYARARAQGLDAELVLAGAGRLARRLEGRPGVRLLGRVDGARLDALYRGALAVVLPSWAEGFGLPPLEALSRGVPPVVSDLAVYDETLGSGALRFPRGDAEALSAALVQIGADAELRARLVDEGRRAMAPLSWEATARGVRDALAAAVAPAGRPHAVAAGAVP